MPEPVTPERLGAVGPDALPGCAYAMSSRVVRLRLDRAARPKSRSWSRRGPRGRTGNHQTLIVCVNRTPITGEIEAARDKRDIDAFGCGLAHTIAQGTEGVAVQHLDQPHHALHADHVRRQGTQPASPSSTRLQTPSARP